MALQLRDDEMATVEEVINFIESIDWDSDLFTGHEMADEGDFILKEAGSSDETASTSSPSERPKQPPKRRRIRTGWSSSTGLQRRKRAELAFLRAHVQELEAFVLQLKTRRPRLKVLEPADWREVALQESVEREKAEETNRRLKATVINQVLLGRRLQDALRTAP
jgi:hypothetical protein